MIDTVAPHGDLYEEVRATYAAALSMLAHGYEADAELRRDLIQNIHVEIWRSLRVFNGQCSLRTWVYRVAHNVGASHLMRMRRASSRFVDLESIGQEPGFDGELRASQQYAVSRLLDRVYRLKPLDRQVILLYLEGEPAASIAEVTGLSATNVATKIHRIKRMLNQESSEE